MSDQHAVQPTGDAADNSAPDWSSVEPLGAGPTRTHKVEHLADFGRFRLLVDDREVAVLDYRRLPGKWNIVHTYTEPASRGYGVASDLVRTVLDTAREQGVKVIPTCEYVNWWIHEYQPGYEDLVVET
jgi:uncharacterized protein